MKDLIDERDKREKIAKSIVKRQFVNYQPYVKEDNGQINGQLDEDNGESLEKEEQP